MGILGQTLWVFSVTSATIFAPFVGSWLAVSLSDKDSEFSFQEWPRLRRLPGVGCIQVYVRVSS